MRLVRDRGRARARRTAPAWSTAFPSAAGSGAHQGPVLFGLITFVRVRLGAKPVPLDGNLKPASADYRQLRRALSRHLADAGDACYFGGFESARTAMSMAMAIEAELAPVATTAVRNENFS